MKKSKLICVLFAALLFGTAIAQLLLPDAALSRSERRKLAQRPGFSLATLADPDYGADLEDYLLDQFPLRDELRTMKAVFRTRVLCQADNNGYYLAGDSLCKLDAPLQEKQVLYGANKVKTLYETYLRGMNVHYAVIPDKGYYAAPMTGRPALLDYDRLLSLLRDNLPAEIGEISLFDRLELDSYYRTDTHWQQEHIFPAASALTEGLGAGALTLTPKDYTAHSLSPFYGVYYGQAALPVTPDALRYLTNSVTDGAVVTGAEFDGTLPVYTTEKFQGLDGYDVFLNGAQAVLTIENPAADSDRELLLFRDSFGSSIAPLLLERYAKITLIDLRYINSQLLPEYVDFQKQDVLFLYSASLWNSAMLLK
ncbi:MAG: DHHW family protein [Oscillospiraceae bacterium]